VRGDLGAGPVFYPWPDENWHWLYGMSYPNYGWSGGTDAYGVWRFIFYDDAVVHIKQVHVFMNAHTYPRFKTTNDNGASSAWLTGPTDSITSFIADDLLDTGWMSGVFLDNVCPFGRFDRTGPQGPGILTFPFSTGISMGDYRPRRYVEVRPPTEADLEDTNVKPSALKVVVRGSGFGSGVFGDVSTARATGTLKLRMVHGDARHVVHNFPLAATDRTIRSQCIPMTPTGFSWQTDRISELKMRMGFHFNYHDKSLNDSYGYQILQNGGAFVKGLAFEVLAETVPGPPICTVGGRWKSRLTRRI